MLKIVNLCITNPEKNKFLFIKRIKPPYIDYWGMLGGKIEKDEEHQIAASRELLEESGIIGNGEFLGKCHEQIFENGNLIHEFDIYFYHFIINDFDLGFDSKEGELKWLDLEELELEKVIPSDTLMIKTFFNRGFGEVISIVKKNNYDYFQEKFGVDKK